MVSDRKVSVIVTCYNEGFLLKRAVLSLMNQTIKNFEIIIVKDLSVHSETIEVCKELEKKGYIVLWSNANIGVSGTRNMGIEKAKGDCIRILLYRFSLPSIIFFASTCFVTSVAIIVTPEIVSSVS